MQARGERSIPISGGTTKTQVVLPAISASEKNQAKSHLFLYRLRYFVSASAVDGVAFQPVDGTISIGEIAPQLFELHAATSEYVKAGNHYAVHVRAIHPSTSAPAQGIAVQASLDIDEDKPILTSKAVTDGRGYATLEFSLPGNLDPDDSDIEVTVTGTRDDFIATANAKITVPESISAIR